MQRRFPSMSSPVDSGLSTRRADGAHHDRGRPSALAAQAIRAGLAVEFHLFTTTTVVGGGTRFFPDGVRLDLELVAERTFGSGLVHTGYRAG